MKTADLINQYIKECKEKHTHNIPYVFSYDEDDFWYTKIKNAETDNIEIITSYNKNYFSKRIILLNIIHE
jgi:hypothetical protein